MVIAAFALLATGHIAVTRREPVGTAEQAQAVADAYAEVAQCMTGRAEVGEHAEIVAELRDVRLALSGEALAQGEEATTRIGLGPDRWPGRCESSARALEQAALQDPAHTAIAYYAVQLHHALRAGDDPVDWIADAYQQFLDLSSTVRDAKGLPTARAPQGAAPPRVQPAIGNDVFPVEFAQLQQVEPNGSRPLRYLFSANGERTVCRFSDELPRRLTGVACAALPAGGYSFASERSDKHSSGWSREAVLDSSGKRLIEAKTILAAAFADDGSALALTHGDSAHWLRRYGPDGKASDRNLGETCMEGHWKPFFLGTELVWQCFDNKVHVVSTEKADDKPHVVADTPRFSDAQDPLSCELSSGPVIAIQGGESGAERAPGKIMFKGPQGWGPARDLTAPVERMRCAADGVSIIGFDEVEPFSYELVYQRCSAERCEAAKRVALRSLIESDDMLPAERSDFDVADLGETMALVWKARTLGARVKVAPFDALASAPVGVVYASADGIFPTDLRLDARGDAAVVSLNLVDGLAFGRIDSKGEITRLSPAGSVEASR